jgi:hypothetical protein
MSFRPNAVTLSVAAVALLVVALRRPEVTHSAGAGMREIPVESNSAGSAPTPVLVELFTSEGCSSCPQADALLARLGRTQPVPGADIIALEEHVDYWDRLGWKDPFSSEAATARQNDYDFAFAGREVYTPQMVVDGSAKFVGSSDSDALRAVRTASLAPKPAVQLVWEKDDTLVIHIEPLNNTVERDGQQVFLVVAENMLHSNVKHGENSGRTLEHDGVVRQFLPIAKIDRVPAGYTSSVAVHSAREWNRANLRAVVFVQERRSRHVIAALAIPFPAA